MPEEIIIFFKNVLDFIILNKSIIIFVLIQLVVVFITTFRNVLTVNGSGLSAAIACAFSYTLGSIVTKLITEQSYEVVIMTTFLTNLIGVYAAKWILEKTKKERLWTIQATITNPDLCEPLEKELQRRGIKYTLMNALNDRYLFLLFLNTKAETSLALEILNQQNVHYSIIENRS